RRRRRRPSSCAVYGRETGRRAAGDSATSDGRSRLLVPDRLDHQRAVPRRVARAERIARLQRWREEELPVAPGCSALRASLARQDRDVVALLDLHVHGEGLDRVRGVEPVALYLDHLALGPGLALSGS